jgi:hypothetical protein
VPALLQFLSCGHAGAIQKHNMEPC